MVPAEVGPTLVIAPHPDDESLGCGGLIAELCRIGCPVWVMIVTDGTGSHPGSRRFPPARLARLRACEARAALAILLGVAAGRILFGHHADRFVPDETQPGFRSAVTEATALLAGVGPATLVIPSGADAHGDHRASAAIWRRAAAACRPLPRLLEYLVWPSAEHVQEGHPVTLDIADALDLKQKAIAAHRSQHGLVVTDDPEGFVLPRAVLDRAADPTETYFERTP